MLISSFTQRLNLTPFQSSEPPLSSVLPVLKYWDISCHALGVAKQRPASSLRGAKVPSDSIWKMAKGTELKSRGWAPAAQCSGKADCSSQGVSCPVLHCGMALLMTELLLEANPQLALLFCEVRNPTRIFHGRG